MPSRAIALGFFALGLLWAGPAGAHQSSVSYSQVQVGDDGVVDYTLRLSSRDLYEALALDRDRDATDAEITAGSSRLFDYVTARLLVQGDGKPCPLARGDLSVLHQTDRFAELHLRATCAVPLTTLGIDYDLFFELDPRHTGMLQVHHGERAVDQEFTTGLQHFEWTLNLAPKSLGAVAYIKKGMEHIYSGTDHIAFLIGLLLVAPIRRRPDGSWEVRGVRAAVPYVLRIVTAFTVAHSLTLILAALDVISLPSRFVESAIAASIVYVAAENLWLGDPRHRWPLAFGFGLVHGLGFAAMLRPILPQTGMVPPLLEFNLGVELGQITIVAPLLPILHFIAARGPRRYQRTVMLGGSAIVGVFGLLWLIERILDVRLITH